jgi:Berberine and berberine like
MTSNIFIGWHKESVDKLMEDAIRSSRATLIAAGIRDGQDLKNAVRYPNYALFGTAVEEMYGEHVGRLQEIRKKYDPFDIMGLAGGWKI